MEWYWIGRHIHTHIRILVLIRIRVPHVYTPADFSNRIVYVKFIGPCQINGIIGFKCVISVYSNRSKKCMRVACLFDDFDAIWEKEQEAECDVRVRRERGGVAKKILMTLNEILCNASACDDICALFKLIWFVMWGASLSSSLWLNYTVRISIILSLSWSSSVFKNNKKSSCVRAWV